ncbi:ACP S-malonyltransferase [Desulfoplanes formicivorans]|uniref:Malonyl CoA-acyl carrier protein transacylase n=1 Tax=Desulfoplanes formicivorans TaxID=1592317 RepID=A0A194AF31_9BACT|nr:ACP S-malonyltransferase [Desulfoplanes formicivorans]GAU07701.1 malonyl CoA-ACP transacylase [Desulfoplanes formicivorans]
MTTTNPLTAILFPGQGSQCPGMGRDLAEYWSDAMELWVRAEKISGFALREIYWDNDVQAMAQTAYLQPALTVVNAALWGFVKSRLSPACAAGHSLGEFSALFASGVLSINDTLDLVCLRGRLMAEASKNSEGKMAAILKLSRETVETLVEDVRKSLDQEILIANYNTPVQFVISGTQSAVSQVASLAKQAKGRAVLLPVSGAFHSPMMAEPAAELAKAMAKVDWKAPVFPVYLNASAQQADDPRVIQRVMTRQMTSSVYWTQLVTAQWEAGIRRFIELGPKGVLSRMTGQILMDHKDDILSENIETLQQAQTL